MAPEREPRSFYGGEVPTGPATTGEIGRAPYEGPGLGPIGVWKCPQCRQDNEGDPAAGCVHCGSGSAQPRHVGVPPIKREEPQQAQNTGSPGLSQPAAAESIANAWARQHPHATLIEAFEAGLAAGFALVRGPEQKAPEQASTAPAFSPTAKVQRTLVAALRLFRDQLEPSAPEITDGEWCSHDEIDHLIHQFEEEPPSHV